MSRVAAGIAALAPGRHPIKLTASGGIAGVERSGEFVVFYDEQPALGDDNKPVRGDVTGDYSVYTTGHADSSDGLRYLTSVHVSPHGTSGYGNDCARPYAAERVLEAMLAEIDRRASIAA